MDPLFVLPLSNTISQMKDVITQVTLIIIRLLTNPQINSSTLGKEGMNSDYFIVKM